MKVTDNLKQIERNIQAACERSGRSRDEVRLIAVTKYVTAERAAEALEAGITDLGENRDSGLLAKYDVLGDTPRWHYIGSLQTRKVKNIISLVDWIHSLDRLSLAEEIQKRAEAPVKCLLQVNVSGEETKHGLTPEEAAGFVRETAGMDKIIIAGLMTMAPLTEDRDFIRSCFRRLKQLQEEIAGLGIQNAPCTDLSMGMSNDYELAIEEGATMIRIGTALVGGE